MFEKNDIVQIIDSLHPWYPALLVVDEVKPWGVQAYCLVPESNSSNMVSQAFNRLKTEQVEKVGHSVIISE